MRTLCICYPAIGRSSIPFCIKPVPSSGHAGLILYIDYMCALHCDENLTCVNSIRVLILFCPRHVAKLLHSCTCILHFIRLTEFIMIPFSFFFKDDSAVRVSRIGENHIAQGISWKARLWTQGHYLKFPNVYIHVMWTLTH